MGSGSSKEKSPKTGPVVQARPDNNPKSSKVPQVTEKRGNQGVVNTLRTEEKSSPVKSSQREFNTSPIKSEKLNDSAKNGHVAKTSSVPTKSLGKFESDSESEGEDISEVIAATRRAQNNRIQQENYYNSNNNNEQSFPETYAQRLQREQYKQQQQMLIRQKTIYRNPDEWEVDEIIEPKENEETGFDVRKFKEANQSNHQTKDIYSSDNTDVTITRSAHNPDSYYTPSLNKQHSLPHYDNSEEALLAEIEKEFDF